MHTVVRQNIPFSVYWLHYMIWREESIQLADSAYFRRKSQNNIYQFILSEAYPLERAGEAIKTLEDRKVLGKVVVSME